MSIETLELFTIGLLLVTLSRVLRARVAAFAGIRPRTPPVPLDPDAG